MYVFITSFKFLYQIKETVFKLKVLRIKGPHPEQCLRMVEFVVTVMFQI